MTRDDTIKMAQEAGLYSGNPRTPSTGNMIIRRLERFAALVAAHEREECAKVCDELEENGYHYETYDGWDEIPAEACHCAAAIRARGEK